VGQTFAMRTYAELAGVTADLPAGLTVAPPLRPPARVRARRPVNKTAIWGASGTITPVMLVLGVVAAHLTDSDAVVSFLVVGAFSYLLVWLLVGVTMVSYWRQQCFNGPTPAVESVKARTEP